MWYPIPLPLCYLSLGFHVCVVTYTFTLMLIVLGFLFCVVPYTFTYLNATCPLGFLSYVILM